MFALPFAIPLAAKIGAVLALVVGLIAGGWYWHDRVYERGVAAAQAQCRSASLEAALAETEKQLRDAAEVIEADRAEAEKLQAEIDALKEQAHDVPPNDAVCLGADAARRIDRVR